MLMASRLAIASPLQERGRREFDGLRIAPTPALRARINRLGEISELIDTIPTPGESPRRITVAAVSVRYIVNDIDAAIAFYTEHLGFGVDLHPAPSFVILSRGDPRLLLNTPNGPGGAAQPMPDGRKPEPGGWNRIQLEVLDLAVEVEALRSAGAHFRNEIVTGMGGKQILLDDPAGNPIELFEPPQK
jgi:catechol 2,3-dioxygenase-like lactoylglutathione lyase family enzyme